MNRIYLITIITGETFAFTSELARKDWMEKLLLPSKSYDWWIYE